ncbi:MULTISPECIES: hypothetical protein [unclassified Microcoleus]|uniref:hypothetical protein n=1 Tax=unclassified Microcoleus TaxID=2642155 RepID=UPI002FD661D4
MIAFPDGVADTEHFVIAAPNLMTGSFYLVYKEIYKDQSIEIYRFSQFMLGGIGSSHYYAIIDDYTLPGNFDCRSHNPFRASEDTQPTPEHSSALAAAKAYCDSKSKAREQRQSEQREDELLSLTLFYRKVQTLLRQFFSSLVKR